MAIILGFGCVEEQVRKDVKQAVVEGVAVGKSVDDILMKWNIKADEFDELPRGAAPERYTRIWHYDDTLHFQHVHRNHPFSPDGWASLQIEEPFLANANGG